MASNPAALATMADRWGWEETATDWRSVVERDDINLQASGANAGSMHVQLLAFDHSLDSILK